MPTGEQLLEANPTLTEPEPLGESCCAVCAGMTMGHIIDRSWSLDRVPTDALMRELARRFIL